MRGTSKTVSFRIRIARMLFRLSYPEVQKRKAREILYVTANSISVAFSSLSYSTIEEKGSTITKWQFLRFPPWIQTTLLKVHTMNELAKGDKVEMRPLSWSKPLAKTADLSLSRASSLEISFPTSRIEKEDVHPFNTGSTSLLPNISNVDPNFQSPWFEPEILNCRRPTISFDQIFKSRLPINVSPCEQTNFLAIMHNDLLSRIDKGLQFIGEIDDGFEKYEKIKESITSWTKLYGPRNTTRRIWDEYPGAASSFLVLAGVYEYTHGEYWYFDLRSIGMPCTPQLQIYWGRRFLLFISIFGLKRFEESGLRYVGPILGHATIPNDCLPEVFGQLLEPAVRYPAWTGLQARELIPNWLAHPARFLGVDKPVWQFLRHGGQFVEEFISETLRMVRRRYETGVIPNADELKLPSRVVQCYQNWLEKQQEPPSPRSPFLRLDPYAGIQLVFPVQILPADCAGQVCSWGVSAANQRLRGPNDYAQIRDGEAFFEAPDMAIPPVGPYRVQLVVGDKDVGTWVLKGMENGRPWKAFSGRNYKELNLSGLIRAGMTWFVIPRNAALIVRDFSNNTLSDVEAGLCYLAEEWVDYKAIQVDLTNAATFEVLCENYAEVVEVEYSEGRIILTGGDLLQSAGNSPDSVDLFGDRPPKVFLQTKPDEESDALEDLRIRIAGKGTKGIHTYELLSADLRSASQVGQGYISINLQQIIPHQLCPGDLFITLWYRGKRALDIRLRWVPGLFWQWHENGRTVNIHLPVGAEVSKKLDDEQLIPIDIMNGLHTESLLDGHQNLELILSWQRQPLKPFLVPLRLCAPRWAYLKQHFDSSIWQVEPIQMSSEQLLEEDNPCVLLEARDVTWGEVDFEAQWIVRTTENPTVSLRAERQLHTNRWLIRLAKISDTLRQFRDADSYILVEGIITGPLGKTKVQLCVMKIVSPQRFQWAIRLNSATPIEWNEICVDLELSALIEGEFPYLLFETKGKQWAEANACGFWRPLDHNKPRRLLSPEACEEYGRWRMNLAPILKFLEECPEQNSEVVMELIKEEPQDDEVQILLIRFRLQPAALITYEDCLHWVGGNSLRAFALDLLCDLNYKYFAPLNHLVANWKTSDKLVRQALQILRIECPDITVTERQNAFAMSKDTYKRLKSVLNEWNQKRMWSE